MPFKFNPARTIASLAVAAQAVVAVLAIKLGWDGAFVVAVDSAITGVLSVFGTLFIEDKSVSKAGLEALVAAERALDNTPNLQ